MKNEVPTTEENNKLIAEFLQPTTTNGNFYFPQFKEPYIYQGALNGYSEVFGLSELKFHTSWNWLMEVVNKITTLEDFQEYDTCLFWEIFCQLSIEGMHEQVIEFIQWYNEQNK